jgi:hypothetical protein
MTPFLVFIQGLAIASSVLQQLISTRVGIFGSGDGSNLGQSLTLVSYAAIYAWWPAAIYAAATGARGGMLALILLNVIWTTLGDGLGSLYFCPPSCTAMPPLGDIGNFAAIITGVVAAVATWRAFRASTGPIQWRFPVTAIVLIVISFALSAASSVQTM